MKIRKRLILIVLPLLTASLLISGIISSYSARSGMTRLAMGSLGFKAEEIVKYMNNQWNMLVENEYSTKAEYVNVAKSSTLSYAYTILRSETELIFAVDSKADLQISTGDFSLKKDDKADIKKILSINNLGWINFSLNGKERVGYLSYFAPFDWWLLITEESSLFYKEVYAMIKSNMLILGLILIITAVFLFILSSYITGPLKRVSEAMRSIIDKNDLSRHVEVEYRDEIGQLANTFNIMVTELDRAYQQIKEYALKAIIAERNERKIRNIFQKYVPKDVIDTVFDNPEKMLIGENRELGILFSDIRSFTTISESYSPDMLVIDLNDYFGEMVDIIISHGGIIDKYIGDAIMAFFGAPVMHDDDSLQVVLAAIEMQEKLIELNAERVKRGKPEFKTGIGVSFGEVTVGNIGSEKKMDYTIIGDMVNLGSRLEGLTKKYKQNIIISEAIYKKVKNDVNCRFVDRVQVKGKTHGESIYTVSKTFLGQQEIAWKIYHKAITLYYKQNFQEAIKNFKEVLKYIPGDYLSSVYIVRCKKYLKNPPIANWKGIEILTTK